MKTPKRTKERLDVLLVARGLFPTRAKAQASILAGQVRLPGRPRLPKAGLELPSDAEVEILENTCPYVSRGGLKLAAALERFQVAVEGRVALDVGSSTGGFTDCLLRHGARLVYAVDVGRAQLASKLRADPRVVSLEQTHIRDVRPNRFDPRPDLAVVDVSFISLTKTLPHILPCLAGSAGPSPNRDIIALIKPQFEVGPKKAPNGIVREAGYREEAIATVRKAAAELGLAELGLMESPLRGARGNLEFLIHLQARSPRG
ncbi:MAG: TlyA family RNA methyltransferase [Elusimicrobia bacterium]|nr:TlyA family RNA methyltransferase [Elusimicrobiota bacterium]